MTGKLQSQSPLSGPGLTHSDHSQFSQYLLQVEEAERARLAQQLHDETTASLTSLRTRLAEFERPAGRKNTKAKIQQAVGILDRTLERVQRIAHRLSPRELETLGLIGSIRKEARMLARAHDFKVIVRIAEDFGRLPPLTELALYRLVQEALHNIGRHARAKQVEIEMSRKGGKIRLLIQDDGAGFSRKPVLPRSFGIVGMRERVRCLNGTFRIRSRTGRGTRIEVYIADCLPAGSGPPEPSLRIVSRNHRKESQ